jgi:aquaporin Z
LPAEVPQHNQELFLDLLLLLVRLRITPAMNAAGTMHLEMAEAQSAAAPLPATPPTIWRRGAIALRAHWPEYLMEGGELGLFMVSACAFTILLEYPGSLVRAMLPSDFVRRMLIGLAMGATALTLTHSPWGKQSGAHMNPAITLTFLRLRKVEPWDAFFYVLAQFTGAITGVVISAIAWRMAIAHSTVNYAATLPGPAGMRAAFAAESAISFVLLFTVLVASNNRIVGRFTGLFAAILVAAYITFESPISGMSMNPARTFGSALSAHNFTGLWIYFLAPPLGMLLAAEFYVRIRSSRAVYCAKFHHQNSKRCIFVCRYPELIGFGDGAPKEFH